MRSRAKHWCWPGIVGVGERYGSSIGEGNTLETVREPEDAENVIDRIVDDGYRHGKFILKVEWYGYEPEVATWKPTAQLSRSVVVTYFRRKRQALPAQVSQAQVG